MTTYIELGLGAGGGGSEFYGDPVPTFAALPVSGQVGEVRLALDTGVLYYWDGAIWNVTEGEVASVAHTDTDSITLTTPSSTLTASLNISADAASVGYLKATTSVKSGLNKGLHVEVPIADTNTTGVISDTDWDTFNGKEPAITATSAGDYYRGDKTFQALNIDALAVLVGGVLNNGSKLLGVEYDVTSATNAGATGVWGYAVSKNLAGGTWLCFGMLRWNDNNSVLTGDIIYGISYSSDASTIGTYDYNKINLMLSDNNRDYNYSLPFVILTSAVPFTAYLNTQFQYTGNIPQHGGKLICLRIR